MCNFINYYHSDIIYFHSSKAGGIGRIANIGASLLLMPSFYEGWGLPIIEDMFYEIEDHKLLFFDLADY